MSILRVLVVDDDASCRNSLKRLFETRNYNVTACDSAEKAIEVSKTQAFDLLLTDLKLPGQNGVELIKKLSKTSPKLVSIVLTGFGTIESAIEATRCGAFHYLTKPFQINEILHLVDRAFKHSKLQTENVIMKQQLRQKYGFDNIVGQSREIMKVFELIEKVANSDSTILVTGESGTGKELVARAIHYNSDRQDAMLVPVNCGAIPAELLESELFGHVKGAFTGAICTRQGRFEVAHRGTIFLDEIGDMSPQLQVKLLRVLQEKSCEMVGSTKPIEVDTRVIAATNQVLEEAVKEKSFREDLYYRLNVIQIHIPALRQRREDIPLLLNHFREKFNREKGRGIDGFSEETMNILSSYNWPGNIRELENLVERVVILKGTGMVQPMDLPERYFRNVAMPTTASFGPNARLPEAGLNFNSTVSDFENSLILQALERTNWNRNRAAKLLGLNRTTLVEKLKKKKLAPSPKQEQPSL